MKRLFDLLLILAPRASDRLALNRQRLLIVAPLGAIARRILEIAGAAGSLSMFTSAEEALRTGA